MNDLVFRISVPGSTANLGPGFDSIGLALNRYLILDIQRSTEWEFTPGSKELEGIPTGKENLVYQVAEVVANDYNMELPPCKVLATSDIPMSRGLGSSAAAIVAGIELANQLLKLNLTFEQRLRYASVYEGHPDNVAASLYGGLVIGSHSDEATELIPAGNLDCDIVAVIPSYELKTSLSRSVLPTEMSYKDAVRASSISNVLVAALLQGNLELAGKMMSLDLFHQPYRKELVPELESVSLAAKEMGAYGTILSGAGPIVLTFAPRGLGSAIQDKFKLQYPNDKYEVALLEVDANGVTVTEKSLTK